MQMPPNIEQLLAEAEEELARLNSRRTVLLERIEVLKRQKDLLLDQRVHVSSKTQPAHVANQ